MLSVDISVLIQEYNKLQKVCETLKGNLEYERQLRKNAEKELLFETLNDVLERGE